MGAKAIEGSAVEGMEKVGMAFDAVVVLCRAEECEWRTWQLTWALAEESLRLHHNHNHNIEATKKDETKDQRTYWV